MKLHFLADPSAMPEITELSLSLVLLVTMGLFLGGFALRQVDQVVTHAAMHEVNAAA